MKRLGVVVATSVGLSALAAGCASTGVSTAPVKAASTGLATPAAASSAAHSAQKAGVGDTIDLSDSTNGDQIAVTVVKVVDPDSSGNEFETPPAGDRFESVQFRITDTGTGSYQDDPLAEASAKDAAGQSLQTAIVTSTAAGAQMPSSVDLAPQDTALGFVTFEVPNGDAIAQVQYSTEMGLLGSTGEWQVGSGQAAPATSAQPAAPVTSSSGASSAQAVVQQYFAAINSGSYSLAWSLGGKNIEQGSYNSFVQGFTGTSSDNVTIVSVSGDTVSVALDAVQTDGTHKYFSGTYTVENGEIVAADIH